MQKYEAAKTNFLQRITEIILMGSVLLIGYNGYFLYIYPQMIVNPNQVYDAKLSAVILSVGISYLYLFLLLPTLLSFWRTEFFIEIDSRQLTGLNLKKEKKELLLSDIVSITKDKGVFWGNVLPSWLNWLYSLKKCMRISDEHGNFILIQSNIIDFGECVEMIRSKSPNIKHVDYGGLDKNIVIWRGPGKL